MRKKAFAYHDNNAMYNLPPASVACKSPWGLSASIQAQVSRHRSAGNGDAIGGGRGGHPHTCMTVDTAASDTGGGSSSGRTQRRDAAAGRVQAVQVMLALTGRTRAPGRRAAQLGRGHQLATGPDTLWQE